MEEEEKKEEEEEEPMVSNVGSSSSGLFLPLDFEGHYFENSVSIHVPSQLF